MVANYPYFGFPNYIRYVNSGIKNPTMVQGSPVLMFLLMPLIFLLKGLKSRGQNSQAFNFQRRNPSFSGGQKRSLI